jgi:hypothetical protein
MGQRYALPLLRRYNRGDAPFGFCEPFAEQPARVVLRRGRLCKELDLMTLTVEPLKFVSDRIRDTLARAPVTVLVSRQLNCADHLPERPPMYALMYSAYFGKARFCKMLCSTNPLAGELVGVIGFEPTTPSSRTRCATRLRYTPTEARLIASARQGRKHARHSRFRWPTRRRRSPNTPQT